MTEQLVSPHSVVAPNVVFEGSHYVGPFAQIGFPGFQHRDWVPSQFGNSAANGATVIGDGFRLLGAGVICAGTHIGAGFRADYHAVIGERCTLADRVVVEYGARIYDDCRIGNDTTIGGFLCNGVEVGEGVVIQGSLVHKRTAAPPEDPPRVLDGAFIGTGAIVIGGVTVAERSFIAAGAVVTKDTEPGYLYVGAPAVKVRRAEWL